MNIKLNTYTSVYLINVCNNAARYSRNKEKTW